MLLTLSVARDMPLDNFLGKTLSGRSASLTSNRLAASLQGEEADEEDGDEDRDGSEELFSDACTSETGSDLWHVVRGAGDSSAIPFMT